MVTTEYRTLIGNPMLVMQCNDTATGSGRKDNEVVAGAASEEFTRWLHHLHGPAYTAFLYSIHRRTAIRRRH